MAGTVSRTIRRTRSIKQGNASQTFNLRISFRGRKGRGKTIVTCAAQRNNGGQERTATGPIPNPDLPQV